MDLEYMSRLAVEAGEIGMRYFGRTKRSYKPDRTIVTEADLAIETFVLERLKARFPDHGMVSEETSSSTSDAPKFIWAVDPVDGTQVFSCGLPFWCVSIGLLEDGKPWKGVIYHPAMQDLYAGDPEGVYLNGQKIEPAEELPLDKDSYLMVPESIHNNYEWDWKGDFLSLGSVAAHCCYVARGGAVGILSRAFIWDLAAGVALMQPLGIESRYVDGSEIDWRDLCRGERMPKPLLGARKGHWAELAACIHNWKRD